MDSFDISVRILLIIAVANTVAWTVRLTMQIRSAPDLATRSGVRGIALFIKRGMTSVIVGLLISILGLVYLYPSIYPVFAMAIILVLFNGLIFMISKYQVGAEANRSSRGKSTWRGKRALRWARESTVSLGLLYALFLGLALIR